MPVRDSMVFFIDSSNSFCYSAPSTSIFDLSGNNFTGMLLNGVSFNEYDKSLLFDGINDEIRFGNLQSLVINKITFSALFKTSNQISRYDILCKWGVGYINSVILLTVGIAGSRIPSAWVSNGVNLQTHTDGISGLLDNSWNYLTATMDGGILALYNNGILLSYSAAPFNLQWTYSNTPLSIGVDDRNEGSLHGNFAIADIHNRALSADEIYKNYMSLKSHFNL